MKKNIITSTLIFSIAVFIITLSLEMEKGGNPEVPAVPEKDNRIILYGEEGVSIMDKNTGGRVDYAGPCFLFIHKEQDYLHVNCVQGEEGKLETLVKAGPISSFTYVVWTNREGV